MFSMHFDASSPTVPAAQPSRPLLAKIVSREAISSVR
jgi:hypothetical protein